MACWGRGEDLNKKVNVPTTHGIFGLPLLHHITSVSASCMPTPVVPAERGKATSASATADDCGPSLGSLLLSLQLNPRRTTSPRSVLPATFALCQAAQLIA